MKNPAKFMREVRQEAGRVTWPTRRETTVSTIMVIVMVVIAAIFFLLADNLISWGIQMILGIGG
ncbi:MAG: preprotein translocase subunit SecE [Rickettsiales bacterium]|nr:preprotein translocase subunit SecE [Rickettsiales bacterium]